MRGLPARHVGQAGASPKPPPPGPPGICAHPLLENLSLDVSSCEVGEQCHRALAALRTCRGLRRLTLGLGAPSVRLLTIALLCVGRLGPTLRQVVLDVDGRHGSWGPSHAATLQPLRGVDAVCVTLRNVRFLPAEEDGATALRLAEAALGAGGPHRRVAVVVVPSPAA